MKNSVRFMPGQSVYAVLGREPHVGGWEEVMVISVGSKRLKVRAKLDGMTFSIYASETKPITRARS